MHTLLVEAIIMIINIFIEIIMNLLTTSKTQNLISLIHHIPKLTWKQAKGLVFGMDINEERLIMIPQIQM